jgi:hypothetical protein
MRSIVESGKAVATKTVGIRQYDLIECDRFSPVIRVAVARSATATGGEHLAGAVSRASAPRPSISRPLWR